MHTEQVQYDHGPVAEGKSKTNSSLDFPFIIISSLNQKGDSLDSKNKEDKDFIVGELFSKGGLTQKGTIDIEEPFVWQTYFK